MFEMHKLDNETHRAVGTAEKFALFSANFEALTETVSGVGGHKVRRPINRWVVTATLYGEEWSTRSVERAERNRKVLPTGTTGAQAREVRDHMARTLFPVL